MKKRDYFSHYLKNLLFQEKAAIYKILRFFEIAAVKLHHHCAVEPLFTQAGYQPLEIGFSPSGRQAVPFGIMVTDVYMRDVFPHRLYHIVERMAASHRLLEVEDETSIADRGNGKRLWR